GYFAPRSVSEPRYTLACAGSAPTKRSRSTDDDLPLPAELTAAGLCPGRWRVPADGQAPALAPGHAARRRDHGCAGAGFRAVRRIHGHTSIDGRHSTRGGCIDLRAASRYGAVAR